MLARPSVLAARRAFEPHALTTDGETADPGDIAALIKFSDEPACQRNPECSFVRCDHHIFGSAAVQCGANANPVIRLIRARQFELGSQVKPVAMRHYSHNRCGFRQEQVDIVLERSGRIGMGFGFFCIGGICIAIDNFARPFSQPFDFIDLPLLLISNGTGVDIPAWQRTAWRSGAIKAGCPVEIGGGDFFLGKGG